mmetsp:Transcript_15689/g.43899  ORF Transcript_15689/g.43899 Transcript_15689/m.43899 type:complete len:682 (+) Transcript_15689:29-2074(+)
MRCDLAFTSSQIILCPGLVLEGSRFFAIETAVDMSSSDDEEVVVGPEPYGRRLLRAAFSCFTVLAVAYLSIKAICEEMPDSCQRAYGYVPGWLIALEPILHQFAPYVNFIGTGFKQGWQKAQPEIKKAWNEAEPGFTAVTTSIDAHLEGWHPWQVAVISSLSTAVVLWLTGKVVEWLHTVNDVGVKAYSLRALKCVPGVQGYINKELAKVAQEIWQDVSKNGIPKDDPPLMVLPNEGFTFDRLKEWIEVKAATSSASAAVGRSRMSGSVYFPQSEKHAELLQLAYRAFTSANPLHGDAFPAVRRMEVEVVAMTASLLGGGPQGNRHVCGMMTSGGTESILSAVKASRDFMQMVKSTKRPEMVIAESAHPAYFKAASYFGLKLVKVPVDKKSFRLTATAVKGAITPDTILVIASAPGYPHGVMDDVADIATVALRARVLLHVDACLGGFVLPFARKLGYPIPPFDFSLAGVTSMSVDTHKFGLSHKGTSVVLFAGPKLRSQLYTAVTEWSGGPYISPGFPGSRSGSLIATAWASLASIGMSGFLELTAGIMETCIAFKDGLGSRFPDLEVMGQPEMSVIAFRSTSRSLNIYQLNDMLSKKGWHLSALHLPPALHMCFTASHTPETAEQLLQDIAACREALLSGEGNAEGGSAKLYGMSSSLPDRKLVGDILSIYQDIQLSLY